MYLSQEHITVKLEIRIKINHYAASSSLSHVLFAMSLGEGQIPYGRLRHSGSSSPLKTQYGIFSKLAMTASPILFS